MLSTLDILYIVLAFCAIALTIMGVLLGSEILRIMKDVRTISHNVEQMTLLVRRLVGLVIPGAERVAHDTLDVEDRIHSFLTRAFHTGSSNRKKTKE
jgi:hypothetical protein